MDSLHLSNPWVRTALAIITFVVFGVAWWLISPLFINHNVNETFPTLAPMATRTAPPAATSTPESTETPTPQASNPNEAMPQGPGMVLLAEGEFYRVTHHGQGRARVYGFADGSRVLRLEDFEVLNGPDLHVYLAVQNPVPKSVGQPLEGYVDLGLLKGNVGNQNYDIPEEVVLADYPSVVIWCVPFRTPFSAATLHTAE